MNPLQASLLSAILLLITFPPLGVWGLGAVALAPLMWASIQEPSWKLRLRNGWLAGTLYWGGVCYWIQFVLEVHGGMGGFGSWGSFLLFAVAKGISMGVFSVAVGWMMPGPLG